MPYFPLTFVFLRFDAFMLSMRDKSTDAIKEQGIFYQAGLTRTKEPVFYCVVKSNLHAPEVDMDLLLLHILKTLQPFWVKPYASLGSLNSKFRDYSHSI